MGITNSTSMRAISIEISILFPALVSAQLKLVGFYVLAFVCPLEEKNEPCHRRNFSISL
jgi:hypothetical protein